MLPALRLHQLCRRVSRPNGTSAAVAGGRWQGPGTAPCRRGVVTYAAQRNNVQKNGSLTPPPDGAEGPTPSFNSATAASSGNADVSSSPLALGNGANLPVLACSLQNSSACENVHTIEDPCLDNSLDLKVYEYMEQLTSGGMTSERAAAVVRQWSGGGGAGAVDLAKLRRYFLKTTLSSVLGQHLPPVVSLWTLTCLSYGSLGQLPAADDAVLPPAVRGALVAVNLMLLVYFSSGSLKHSGRLFRVGRAAFDFSSRAELVLLALEDLANGHGALLQAARGQASDTPAGGSATRSSYASSSLLSSPGGGGFPLAAVQRRATRQRVLDACRCVMLYVKQQATGAAAAAPLPSVSSTGAVQPQDPGRRAAAAVGTPLSTLDSFLVLQAAATVAATGAKTKTTAGSDGGGGGKCSPGGAGGDRGFDPVAELGMTPTEAAAAAAMYARFGDSARGGRIGDFELRRLLHDADAPALSEDERRLALALHATDPRVAWLSFRDWATWWAATPAAAATTSTKAGSMD